MNCRNKISCAFLVTTLSLYGQGNTGDTSPSPRKVKLNGGLEAELLTLGRSHDQRHLTISVKIRNLGRSTAYLLLVDNPVATDNTGGAFDSVENVGGITYCRWSPSTACVMTPDKSNGSTPLQSITQLDPDSDPAAGITLNVRLRGQGDGALVSFSMHLYVRLVADPLKDSFAPEAQKYREFRMMTLSFPAMSPVEGK